jgi:integrase
MAKYGTIFETRTRNNERVWIFVRSGYIDPLLIDWQKKMYALDSSPNTVKAYVYDLTKLWDFWFEYQDKYHLSDNDLPTAVNVLADFKVALLRGDKNLGWTPIDRSSAKRILAAINSYIDLANPRISNPKIPSSAWSNPDKKMRSFFAHLRAPKLREDFRAKRMVRIKDKKENYIYKHFPFKHIKSLLLGEPCARDQCLYLLEAIGGLRESEALNMWVNDISYENGRVVAKVINPEKRRVELWQKYRLLPDPFIRNKGRTTEEVFFIDGNGLKIWEAYQRYIYTERIPTEEHPYLFQTLKKGRYYSKRFMPDAHRSKLTERCSQLKIEKYGPHSLRHFYGTFSVNILAKANPDITIEIIQAMMGHVNIESTRKYSRLLPQKIRQELEEADIKLRKDGLFNLGEMEYLE